MRTGDVGAQAGLAYVASSERPEGKMNKSRRCGTSARFAATFADGGHGRHQRTVHGEPFPNISVGRLELSRVYEVHLFTVVRVGDMHEAHDLLKLRECTFDKTFGLDELVHDLLKGHLTEPRHPAGTVGNEHQGSVPRKITRDTRGKMRLVNEDLRSTLASIHRGARKESRRASMPSHRMNEGLATRAMYLLPGFDETHQVECPTTVATKGDRRSVDHVREPSELKFLEDLGIQTFLNELEIFLCKFTHKPLPCDFRDLIILVLILQPVNAFLWTTLAKLSQKL